jgi:hypothetical protein
MHLLFVLFVVLVVFILSKSKDTFITQLITGVISVGQTILKPSPYTTQPNLS